MNVEFDPDLVQDFDDETLIRLLQQDKLDLPEEHIALIMNEMRGRRQSSSTLTRQPR